MMMMMVVVVIGFIFGGRAYGVIRIGRGRRNDSWSVQRFLVTSNIFVGGMDAARCPVVAAIGAETLVVVVVRVRIMVTVS